MVTVMVSRALGQRLQRCNHMCGMMAACFTRVAVYFTADSMSIAFGKQFDLLEARAHALRVVLDLALKILVILICRRHGVHDSASSQEADFIELAAPSQ